MWGLDCLAAGQFTTLRKRLRSASCAVLSHHAAIDRRGQGVLAVLEALGVSPKVVFSPEHGLYGVAQAEEAVETPPQAEGEPLLVSLYGSNKESLTPTSAQLEGVDLLLIDLVDVGTRYYTYVWTALLAARAAADRGIHTLVLDRPNPLGSAAATLEGKPQQPGFLSFVGLEPLPIRHGLTLGEILALCFERDARPLGNDGALSLISAQGWERQRTAEAWTRPFVPPSPNMPSLETALLYPGGCLVEGTNLSEGRGTCFPFRAIGAPFLSGARLARELAEAQLPGLLVRPTAFRPSFEKHAGQICEGVMLHVVNSNTFQPVRTFLTLLTLARAQAPGRFHFLDRAYEFETEIPAFDLLCGNAEVRAAILNDAPAADAAALLCPLDAEQRALPAYAEALAKGAHA
jgi:uncharacterized protein YbbC (DUF1343 family)